jgi:hypothetical protein
LKIQQRTKVPFFRISTLPFWNPSWNTVVNHTLACIKTIQYNYNTLHKYGFSKRYMHIITELSKIVGPIGLSDKNFSVTWDRQNAWRWPASLLNFASQACRCLQSPIVVYFRLYNQILTSHWRVWLLNV